MNKLILTLVAIVSLIAAQAQSKKSTTISTRKSTKSSFIVISKKDLNLRVYDVVKGDTVLLQEFPAQRRYENARISERKAFQNQSNSECLVVASRF